MATKVLSVPEMNAQSAALDKQEAALSTKVDNSPSFWADNTTTKSDVNADIQLRALQARQEKLQSNLLARAAYGDPTATGDATTQAPREGLMTKGLDISSRLLYGVVGAASFLAGKGKATFGDSVMAGVQARETWGDLLKKSNVMPSVASTLGFGLDVLLDPVNLLSGGLTGLERTTAGKIVTGAAKAGVEGAAAGARVGLLDMASRIASWVPGLRVNQKAVKIADEMLARGVERGSPEFDAALRSSFYPSETGIGKVVGDVRMGVKNLAEKTIEARNTYDNLVGFDINKILEARAERESIAGKIKSMLVQLPGGESLVNKFEYNSNQWTENAKLWDQLVKALGDGQEIKQVFNPVTGLMEAPSIAEIQDTLARIKAAPETSAGIKGFAGEILDKKKSASIFDKEFDSSASIFDSAPGTVEVHSPIEGAAALSAEARNQAIWDNVNNSLVKMMGTEEQGVVSKVRDAISKNVKIKDVEVGKKLLEAYDIFMGIFKSAKISSLSPSSMVYAVLGNGTMQHMAGIDMLRPEVYDKLLDATAVLTGGKYGGAERYSKAIYNLTQTPRMAQFWATHGGNGLAAKSLGFDGQKLGASTIFEQIIDKTKSSGGFSSLGSNAYATQIQEELKMAMKDKGVRDLLRQTTPLEYYMREGMNGMRPSEMPTGILANELAPHKAFLKLKETLAKSAADGNGGAKVLTWMLNRSRDFEMTDQAWKLQNFMLLTQDGVSERELLKLTNNFLTTTAKIAPGDIAEVAVKNGQKYYKLTPEKAIDVANEIFMNYAAMPAFVKAVRSMPVLGSPFFAFTYAMLAKTGKTLLNNPASFNQVNFLIQELQKDKSPLEREALKSKYYAWMDTPGMMNLGENVPFFKGHPVYLNLAQMIPYYSMNILNPSERRFNADVRGQVAEVVDKSPLFKDPIGQLLLDYVILPSIIADQQPQNMFGGPLYAPGTSKAEQAALAARSFAESVLPSAAAPVGLGLSDKALQWFPSYPGRKLAFATRGKTTLGIMGNEDPASRGLRAALSIVGVNLYPMDLNNIAAEIKKRQ